MNTLTNVISYIGCIVLALVLVVSLTGTFFSALVCIALQTPLACVTTALASLTAACILFVHNTWLYTID